MIIHRWKLILRLSALERSFRKTITLWRPVAAEIGDDSVPASNQTNQTDAIRLFYAGHNSGSVV